MEGSAEINRAWWDERAPAHAASPDYALAQFIADPDHLSHVVQFDRPLLGDIAGARGVHLQCHIGTDTVSLARLGAEMTGVDFSPPALRHARELAARIASSATFVESDVHDAVAALGAGCCDLLYTGVGAICWVPSIRRWAGVVAELLAPGGRLFIREGHPMLWTLTSHEDRLVVVTDPYFEHDEPYVDDAGGTYAETDVAFARNLTHSWNHGLGEIITALLEVGMEITSFVEHDSVPWNALPGLMHEIGGGEWQLIDRPRRVAHTYTLQAVRR